jgi:hypothetical protein
VIAVEICRTKGRVAVPDDLSASYLESLARLPGFVTQVSGRDWDAGFLACAMRAIAAAKGQHAVAEAVPEMSSPEVAERFLDSYFEQ